MCILFGNFHLSMRGRSVVHGDGMKAPRFDPDIRNIVGHAEARGDVSLASGQVQLRMGKLA